MYEPSYFEERGILAPTHEHVDKINDRLLEMLPGDPVVYLSSDYVSEPDRLGEQDNALGSPEFLNTLKLVFLTTCYR